MKYVLEYRVLEKDGELTLWDDSGKVAYVYDLRYIHAVGATYKIDQAECFYTIEEATQIRREILLNDGHFFGDRNTLIIIPVP